MEQHYGARIKAIRESKGIMAKYVAQKLKIDQSYYSQLESGKRRVTMTRAQQIADILGVSPGEFFACPEVSKMLSCDEHAATLDRTGTGGH